MLLFWGRFQPRLKTIINSLFHCVIFEVFFDVNATFCFSKCHLKQLRHGHLKTKKVIRCITGSKMALTVAVMNGVRSPDGVVCFLYSK